MGKSCLFVCFQSQVWDRQKNSIPPAEVSVDRQAVFSHLHPCLNKELFRRSRETQLLNYEIVANILCRLRFVEFSDIFVASQQGV